MFKRHYFNLESIPVVIIID